MTSKQVRNWSLSGALNASVSAEILPGLES